MPGNTYEFSLSNAALIASVEGADLNKADPRAAHAAKLLVRFPSGWQDYVERRIALQFVRKRQAASAAKN